jgi:hypothetical protein
MKWPRCLNPSEIQPMTAPDDPPITGTVDDGYQDIVTQFTNELVYLLAHMDGSLPDRLRGQKIAMEEIVEQLEKMRADGAPVEVRAVKAEERISLNRMLVAHARHGNGGLFVADVTALLSLARADREAIETRKALEAIDRKQMDAMHLKGDFSKHDKALDAHRKATAALEAAREKFCE